MYLSINGFKTRKSVAQQRRLCISGRDARAARQDRRVRWLVFAGLLLLAHVARVAVAAVSPPHVMRTAAGGTASTKGYFGDTGRETYPALETRSVSVPPSPLHLWRASGGQQGRPVLLVQGLLFQRNPTPLTPQEVYENQASNLVDSLRAAGHDVWILAFSDTLAPFAAQAFSVSDAVRIASEAASGARVNVIALSTGGLAARYALARDEVVGGPSSGRIGVFATVDTPHQGANIPESMQAVLWALQASTNNFREDAQRLLRPGGVQNMLYKWVGPTNFSQDICAVLTDPFGIIQIPIRVFPADTTIRATTAAHDAFYAELRAVNGDGYPHRSRNIAVATGTADARPGRVGNVMYRLTALDEGPDFSDEYCHADYRAHAEDLMPGSIFPYEILLKDREDILFEYGAFRKTVTFQLDKQFNPTFIPRVSALDLSGTGSPFAATFSPSRGEFAYGQFAPGAVQFLLDELVAAP